MSIKAMQIVWEKSRAKGTARVVMLALADHANEQMEAYPSLGRLAVYANVDRRNVIEAIDRLIAFGEIAKIGSGRRNVNIYRITLTSDEIITGDEIITSDETITTTGDESVTRTSDASITRTTREPSINPQLIRAGDKNDIVQTMIKDWNDFAADLGLSTVQKMTGPRRAKALARLKDCGGIDGWRTALEKVRAAKWMWDGTARGGWRANFDFLLQESRFVKLMEGGYGKGGGVPEDPLMAAVAGMRGERR